MSDERRDQFIRDAPDRRSALANTEAGPARDSAPARLRSLTFTARMTNKRDSITSSRDLFCGKVDQRDKIWAAGENRCFGPRDFGFSKRKDLPSPLERLLKQLLLRCCV